ncbi:MAG: sugar phosphate isomerase/epimerase [Anaerolineae bacterium]|nr:sugar phosphate isomerase/epimerase [Anaerolineae bacterium]
MVTLSTGSLYTYGLNRVFGMAVEAGFDGIEVLIDNRRDTYDPAYLRRLSAEHGLPIRVLHSPFTIDVPGWPPDQLGRLEHTVALAQELGVPTVVTHLPFRIYGIVAQWHGERPRQLLVPVPWPRKDAYYRSLENGGVEALEAASGVTIGVENMPSRQILGRHFNAYRFNTLEHLSRFQHLTLDTTHLGTWGLHPPAVYERLKEKIVHVHLSNYDGREHRLPMNGHLPLGELLRAMARNGYARTISIEVGPDALASEDEALCLEDLRRAVGFCRENFQA